jgi:hypothetical protein
MSKHNLTLILSNDAAEIKALVAEGFCPIECSIGGESIVDDLMMDHHGKLSHLEPVSIRAYRDHFGTRAADPRFVTTGAADADACFTAAALAGMLPHPSRVVADNVPPPVKAAITCDLTTLADTVARIDVSPIGLDIASLPGGDMLITWNVMTQGATDTLGFYQGVAMWRTITEKANPASLKPFLDAGKASELARRQAALDDLERCGQVIDEMLVLNGSRVFGFSEWYGRNEVEAFESVEGWKHPIVIALTERDNNVTIGCPNTQVAESLFGAGGLKNVFAKLQPEGWGGREAVGGSPRGSKLSFEQVEMAAKVVASLIQR